MDRRHYRESLKKAQDALLKLYQQREAIDREIARTRQYVQSVLLMLSESFSPETPTIWDVIGGNLTEAVKVIVSGSNRPLTAIEIRDQLIKLGFEVKSSNPLASIYSVLTRMVQQGAIHMVCKTHPDGELDIMTRAYWWGEYGGLPRGWVLQDSARTERMMQAGNQRMIRGRERDRVKALKEIQKRSKVSERKEK